MPLFFHGHIVYDGLFVRRFQQKYDGAQSKCFLSTVILTFFIILSLRRPRAACLPHIMIARRTALNKGKRDCFRARCAAARARRECGRALGGDADGFYFKPFTFSPA